MRDFLIILGGIIGAYLFSKYWGKSNNNNNQEINNFWYRYNHPTYKNNTRYNNHCWRCGKKIDSYYDEKCPECGWYICSNCGACSNNKYCSHNER